MRKGDASPPQRGRRSCRRSIEESPRRPTGRAPSLIIREIDASTGLLQTPYCPRESIRSEFFIPGTEPARECDRHLGYMSPEFGDTLGLEPPPGYGQPVVPPVRGPARPDTIRSPTDSVRIQRTP